MTTALAIAILCAGGYVLIDRVATGPEFLMWAAGIIAITWAVETVSNAFDRWSR